MSARIKNKNSLLSHGCVQPRDYAIQLAERGLDAVDVYKATKRLVKLEAELLRVNGRGIKIREVKKIYVLGAGKATAPIARALEEILGDRLTKGVIVVKYGYGEELAKVRVIEASHPLPDKAGYMGTLEITKIADEVREGDLVFCPISGGASALMPMPAGNISLEEEIAVNRLLLTSGARINEINTVRNHISSIKGGRLATRISPGEIINLIVADEPGAKPWGPTVPDRSTFEDAIRILREYGLWQGIPQRVRRHLQRGLTDRRLETPKSLKSVKVQNVILADNPMACEAARMEAIQLGLDATVLTCNLEGESAAVGESIAALALRSHLARSNRGTPTVLILGGETVVTMSAEHGLGGPSQELALSFARKIAGYRNIALLALDTDGSDGPTDVAGAIVDSLTMKRAEKLGLDLADSLRRHLSYDALSKLQDAIVTGPTGTNVMDLNIVVVI